MERRVVGTHIEFLENLKDDKGPGFGDIYEIVHVLRLQCCFVSDVVKGSNTDGVT